MCVQLTLKGELFGVYTGSSDTDVEQHMVVLDDLIEGRSGTKKELMQKGRMQEFFDNNVQERHYSFCIIKCADIACPFHKPRRLPEVIAEVSARSNARSRCYTLQNLSVKSVANTQQKDIALKETNKEAHQLPFNPSAQTAGRVKRVLTCQECEQPRVEKSLDATLEQTDYTCGSSMTDFIDTDDSSRQHPQSSVCATGLTLPTASGDLLLLIRNV